MTWKFWRKKPSAPAPVKLDHVDYEKLRLIMEIVTPESKPNLNRPGEVVRDIRLIALNVKSLGYELARQLAEALPPPADGRAACGPGSGVPPQFSGAREVRPDGWLSRGRHEHDPRRSARL